VSDTSCFKAGKIRNYLSEWKNLTSDQFILEMVCGAEIPISDLENLPSDSVPCNNVQGDLFDVVDAEVKDLLEMEVIEYSQYDPEQIISPIFLVPKPDGTYRMILNLKKFNESVQYDHFKMENLVSATNMIKRNCYMASVDLKHAYYSVSIKKEFRKYLKFIWRDNLYEFTCFPNGLSNCPRYFTKLMKPVYATLRAQGFLSASFIDDCYLQGDTYDDCLRNVNETVNLFESLGFTVHKKKSVLTPCRRVKYLGFWLDSENMTVSLPEEKADHIMRVCTALIRKRRMTVRELAQVIGLLVSSFPGVLWGPLFYRQLEKVKSTALKRNRGDFDALTVLSQDAINELKWWLENVSTCTYPLEQKAPEIEIYTDASTLGYGAVCGKEKAGGRWSFEEKDLHINVLELLAIEFALKCFSKLVTNKHVKILCDNTCAVTYIRKMGGSHSDECNSVANRIWHWCRRQNIWLTISHVAGKDNNAADEKSRKFDDSTEWKLNHSVFVAVMQHFAVWPEIDLFASRLNYQIKPFVSWGPDPEAFAVDAFSISWKNRLIYAFPPFSVVQRVLSKMEREATTGVLILPNWPTAVWYPQMLRLLMQDPVLLPKGKTVLQLSHSDTPHPLFKNLQLLAVTCSGKPCLHREYMERLEKLCVHPGENRHRDNTLHILTNGKFSVLNERLIRFVHL
jgi:hypothetical protein